MHGNPSASAGLVASLILLLVGSWLAISYLTAFMSGWHKLGECFRCEREFTGERWVRQSAGMRWATRYSGILTIGANQEGLYLATQPFFRMGHPPLFVPWSEIAASDKKLWMMAGTQFVVGRETQIPIWVYAKLAAKIRPYMPTVSDQTSALR